MKPTLIAAMVGGMTVAGFGLVPAAQASFDAVPALTADALDRLPVALSRHTREHRMQEIEYNLERQDRRVRRGYGPPPGYGERRGYGDDRGYDRGSRREWRYD